MGSSVGVEGYGIRRSSVVHRLYAARLYRLVLEKGRGGATYHGVSDEGVPTREIAEVIGRSLNVPGRQQVARGSRRSFWLDRSLLWYGQPGFCNFRVFPTATGRALPWIFDKAE